MESINCCKLVSYQGTPCPDCKYVNDPCDLWPIDLKMWHIILSWVVFVPHMNIIHEIGNKPHIRTWPVMDRWTDGVKLIYPPQLHYAVQENSRSLCADVWMLSQKIIKHTKPQKTSWSMCQNTQFIDGNMYKIATEKSKTSLNLPLKSLCIKLCKQ